MSARTRALKRLGHAIAENAPTGRSEANRPKTERQTRAKLHGWIWQYRFSRFATALAFFGAAYWTIRHGWPGFGFGLLCIWLARQTEPRQDEELDRYTGRKSPE